MEHRSLVSPEWLESHLNEPRVRVVQSDMTLDDYQKGHIPGAVFWHSLQDVLLSDLSLNLGVTHWDQLMSRSGIERDSIVVFSSPYAPTSPYLKWVLGLFGHPESRILDGGSARWKREGRSLEKHWNEPTPTHYHAAPLNNRTRAFEADVVAAQNNPNAILIDARTIQEFRGELFMLEPPKDGQKAGHIEGALHLPFELAMQPNDTFKNLDDLRELYASHGITPDHEIITYCTVGARSSLTWFVLSELLGFSSVRNYDGSWNQWSRRQDVP